MWGSIFIPSGGFSVCMNGFGGCFSGLDMGCLMGYLCLVALGGLFLSTIRSFCERLF